MLSECFLSGARSTAVWHSSDVCNSFIHTSAVAPSTTCQLHITLKSQWTGKTKIKKHLNQTFSPSLSFTRTAGRIQIYPSIQIYPTVLCIIWTPLYFLKHSLLISAWWKTAASPMMWFLDIHANKRSVKLCIAHSHGNMVPNRLMHPVGSRAVDAWSSSELEHAVCFICTDETKWKSGH